MFEYDVHLCTTRLDPKMGDPDVIGIEIDENVPHEWPDEIHENSLYIIQISTVTGKAVTTAGKVGYGTEKTQALENA